MGKEPRPILRRMQNANDHDGFSKRLVENQVIGNLRDDEPTDWLVACLRLADAPPKFRMLCEQIGGIEDEPANAFPCFGIVGGKAVDNFVQVSFGSGTKPGRIHGCERSSSVVLA